MAQSNVIQEFLVGLGWKIDNQGQQRFVNAIATAKKSALALTATFTGIVVAVAKVAQSYNQLEYAGERAQSSVEGMQKIAFAVSQVGGNADAARASMQAIGNFLRSSPGSESFIQRLGVNTRNAAGNLRDTSTIMQELSVQFKKMPYWQAKASAGILGIDENTLQAMLRGLGNFGKQYADIYKAVGVDQDKAAKASVKFTQQFNLTGVAIKALRDRVAVSLMNGVGSDIVKFRNILVSHAAQISDAIEKVAKFVLKLASVLMKMFEVGVDVISGLYGQFQKMDWGTKTWIGTLGGLFAAWRLFSGGLLATPLWIIFAVSGAILSLYDDYKTWKEGGKSLIDWGKWKPGLDAFTKAITNIMDIFKTMWPHIRAWTAPLLDYFKTEFLNTFTFLGKMIEHLSKALDDLLNGHFNSAWGNAKEAFKDLQDFSKKDQEASENLTSDYEKKAAGSFVHFQQKLTGLDPKKINEGLQYLTSQGIDREHALAMIGNWQQESSLDPKKVGPDGKHWGLEQWDQSRREKIRQGTGIDVKNANFADSMKAAVWELKNGQEVKHFKQFMQTSGLDAATAYFNKNVEVSGEKMDDKNMLKRMGYAHNADVMTRVSTVAQGDTNNHHINQTITINGVKEPQATAQAIKKVTQQTQNASLVRNMKGRRA